jgi:hypothetical protein
LEVSIKPIKFKKIKKGKVSYKNIKDILSSDEMKGIIAGCGSNPDYCGYCGGRACYRTLHDIFGCYCAGTTNPC